MGRHSLDSLEEDISDDKADLNSSSEEEIKSKKSKKAKHSSHRKKKSKDKKHKKESKKHRSKSSSAEESSNSNSEDEWVEKLPEETTTTESPEDDSVFKKPRLEPEVQLKASSIEREDEWMNFSSTISTSTYSNDGKKAERRKQREEEKMLRSIDQTGRHVKELNPYWKDGGHGLPEKRTESEAKSSSSEQRSIGDGGLSWLRKFFLRAKQQAKEENRSVEDVVSERYGSLEAFLKMLEEAESKAEGIEVSKRDKEDRRDSRKFIQPSRDSDDDEDYPRRRSSSTNRRHDRHGDRRRNRSREREGSSGWRKTDKGSSTSQHHKAKSQEGDNIPNSSKSSSISTSGVSCHERSKLSIDQNERCNSPPTDPVEKDTPKVLSDKEMNELNAKLLKAEMLGNTTLVIEIKNKIVEAESGRQNFIKNGGDISQMKQQQTKVVTKVILDTGRDRGRRVKDKITETHKDGQRVRYFPDDDKYSLHNMFQKEKLNTAADENALFARLAGKGAKTGQDYDADDVFTDKASSSKQASKEQEREIRDVLDQEKQYKKILDTCPWCFDSSVSEKHLIISVAEKSYLCVPPYQSLTEGHCLIVPMSHAVSSTELDEDVWSEMQKFRKALVRMFREVDQDMVIFETALFLKRHPHMYLECVPMPKETGELAPIYFKKAIQECETEWSHNKKLVDLRNRDVRRAIPKALPYFSVDFGDDSCGFAHVVEDERNFPKNFAHEVVGGMMELDHQLWRKQKKDDFKKQRSKVMEFLKLWAPFDWTRDLS